LGRRVADTRQSAGTKKDTGLTGKKEGKKEKPKTHREVQRTTGETSSFRQWGNQKGFKKKNMSGGEGSKGLAQKKKGEPKSNSIALTHVGIGNLNQSRPRSEFTTPGKIKKG